MMKETVLITGASGGFGEAFARRFAATGNDLVLVARSVDKLEALKKELEAAHDITVHTLAKDLSLPDSPKEVVAWIEQQQIRITTLINNAGYGSLGDFAHADRSDQLGMIDLNVRSLTELTHLLLPGMIAHKHGRILNIASTAAFQPGPYMAVYYATKAYVMNFSLALSSELRGTGVTVTCLCPGPTKTGFAQRAALTGSTLFFHAMSIDTVISVGLNALERGKPLVVAGLRNKIGAFGTRLVPRMSAAGVARRLQKPQK